MSTLRLAWTTWDAVISRLTFASLDAFGWQVYPVNETTRRWPAVESPTLLISCLIVYLLIVCGGRKSLSSKSTDNKERENPYLKVFVIVHNTFLILLSAYMCLGCIFEAYNNGYKFWGNKYDAGQTKLAGFIYLFFVSKIYEFIDTFIMLLKGNVKQISFLHVYHHATISFIWWMIVRVAPGGDAYFSAALNSWVHVCMYSYYLLAILLGKSSDKRRRYLWWGRYLTQMQMFQFVLNLLQALYCSKFSPYPRFLSEILLVYMATLLALFGQFYYSKHIASVRKMSKKRE
ncbi:ELO family [Ostreococcus tauri]|jgi:elongation of very long chain fatty acids protein 4|uniref:ELO family n=1 Tax=Ostreococcus tauri TaxID=70448 RepID=A0A1Y5I1J6_OSTTA|nr:ELO family [Ostreococcus tauri]